MVTTALKGEKNLRTQVCTTGDPHLFSHRHTLVDKDNTEWSDDQNNIRAEEACRAHKTGKIKNTGGVEGGCTQQKGHEELKWLSQTHFYFFFSDTSLCHLFWEKSFSNFFSLFKALFIPIRTKHGRHNLTQGTWKGNKPQKTWNVHLQSQQIKKERKEAEPAACFWRHWNEATSSEEKERSTSAHSPCTTVVNDFSTQC